MNHLAHLFLSGDDELLLVGNFMADHVKGRDLSRYPARVADGIRLHRLIDTFTDSHPVVEESKRRLRPRFRKYAPVVADMYYDHFLAVRWEAYSDGPLASYSASMYRTLDRHRALMPERSLRFLQYMVRHDWLTGYGTFQGLHDVLCGMAGRTRFVSHMEQAAEFLEAHYERFGDEFGRFFPALCEYVGALHTQTG